MSRTEITNRLGVDPGQWDFHGQVYSTPGGMTRLCALTLEETRICFTIKPKSGKGRMTISDRAIKQFERWNPDLYVKLHTGLMFLQVHNRAVDASIREQERINRIRSAEKRYNDVKKAARGRIDAYRRTIKKGALPEYLEAMKSLLQRPSPYFEDDEARALWFDQGSVAIEQVILTAPDAAAPDPQVRDNIAAVAASSPQVRDIKAAAAPPSPPDQMEESLNLAFTPIEEIDF